MSTTIRLLNELKSRLSLASDYSASNLLGVTHQTLAQCRKMGSPMSDKLALKCCALAGIDPAAVLLSLRIDRAKCDDEISVWKYIQIAGNHLQTHASNGDIPLEYSGIERRAP